MIKFRQNQQKGPKKWQRALTTYAEKNIWKGLVHLFFFNTNDPSSCRSYLDCDVCGVLANRLGVKGECLESHHCVLGGHEPALQQNSSLFKLTSLMFVVKIMFNYPTPPSLLYFSFSFKLQSPIFAFVISNSRSLGKITWVAKNWEGKNRRKFLRSRIFKIFAEVFTNSQQTKKTENWM